MERAQSVWGPMRWRFLLLCFLPAACAVASEPLLREVAEKWLAERNRWAFTQHVREFDGDTVVRERVERFDPTAGDGRRWRLLSFNGAPPGPEFAEAWERRKNNQRRRKITKAADYFDFDRAILLADSAERVRYQLPLQSGVEWLFPTDKVELVITIHRPTRALEQVQARISEPFRVALGLARVLDIDMDVQMEPPPASDPADAKPTGSATAVVTKLGRRVEYAWSDFTHVASPPAFAK